MVSRHVIKYPAQVMFVSNVICDVFDSVNLKLPKILVVLFVRGGGWSNSKLGGSHSRSKESDVGVTCKVGGAGTGSTIT